MSAFLKQFEELKKGYPLIAFRGDKNDNSEYGNYLEDCKDLYFSFDCSESNDSFYLFDCYKMENCVDANFSVDCQNSYEISDSATCYNSIYMLYSAHCYDCYFCTNCVSCHDCFGCVNLEHKQYCIYNKQYSKEEYFEKIKELKKGKPGAILEKVSAIEKKFPKLYAHNEQNENSDYCNYIFRSNNCYFCFDSTDLNDCGYMFSSYESANCWDGSYNLRCERCYEANDSVDCYNSAYIDHSERCYDSFFLYNCKDLNNCFGCSNLSHKSHCILNKQYSEEEYFEKIKDLRHELGWKSEV